MTADQYEWSGARNRLVDEMLAICNEADCWKEKKANAEANAKGKSGE